jgi:flagellar M-ring protein FliF
METQLEDRARAMLEKVVGAGHVDVRVSADLDLSRVERVEDKYEPRGGILRSEEQSLERSGDGSDDENVAGVPGAESNLPGSKGAKAKTSKLPSDVTRESHTRNYEIDHVMEKRLLTAPTLKRLTVAVIVDGVPKTDGETTKVEPRSGEELTKLAALVKTAVGADDARGDVVTVDSVPFLETAEVIPLAPAPTAPPVLAFEWEKYLPAAIAAGVLVLGAGFFGIWRRRKRIAAAAKEAEDKAMKELAAPAEAPKLSPAPPIDLRAAAHEKAARDPATAALVLRSWLGHGAADAPAPH